VLVGNLFDQDDVQEFDKVDNDYVSSRSKRSSNLSVGMNSNNVQALLQMYLESSESSSNISSHCLIGGNDADADAINDATSPEMIYSTEEVQVWASLGGSLSYTNNPTVGLCSGTFLHTTSDNSQTRLHKKHKQPLKHHYHGGGAACPFSSMESMNPRRPKGRRPCAYFF
jgi:hypothetical protein